MKYYKRLKVYKASNVQYNPECGTGYSYGWWQVVRNVNGKVLFNNYSYSNSTAKHQHKLRSLLSDLGIEVDLFVHAPWGLQNLDAALQWHRNYIQKLGRDMAKRGSRKEKNEWRWREAVRHMYIVEELQQLNNLERRVA